MGVGFGYSPIAVALRMNWKSPGLIGLGFSEVLSRGVVLCKRRVGSARCSATPGGQQSEVGLDDVELAPHLRPEEVGEFLISPSCSSIGEFGELARSEGVVPGGEVVEGVHASSTPRR